jgi:hypothetical protein
MRRTIGEITVILSLAAAAQSDAPKPAVSDDPLTTEQIAVYRAVLEDYAKDSKGALNAADKTYPLKQAAEGLDEGCFKEIQTKTAKDSVPIVRKLDDSLRLDRGFFLVDSDRQTEKIRGNNRQKPSRTGLFTLSEILFDEQHLHAVVAYNFVCGGLCGHGKLLALASQKPPLCS